MDIVMNENAWAANAIRERVLGKKPMTTLRRVARYYIEELGVTDKSDLRRRLELFVLQCEPTSPLPKWVDIIDTAIRYAAKSPSISIDCITITVAELEVIDGIRSVIARRLAFTLLCLAKYWNEVNNTDTYWVNTNDTDIMRMANIRNSIKYQGAVYNSLRESGLINYSKKIDNLNVQVLFAKDGDTALEIDDMRNLGYQYLMHCGEPFFRCQNCGLTVKATKQLQGGRKNIYCPMCADEIRVRRQVNYAMRRGAKRPVQSFSQSIM